jgi:hypothetical protein
MNYYYDNIKKFAYLTGTTKTPAVRSLTFFSFGKKIRNIIVHASKVFQHEI